MQNQRTSAIPAVGLLLIAVLFVVHLARAFLMPIVVALLAYWLLVPAVRALHRLHIPRALGAALLLLPLVALSVVGVYELSEPASEWIGRAPEIVRQLEGRLRSVGKPVADVAAAAERVQDLASGGDGEPAIEVRSSSFTIDFFGITTSFLAAAGTSVVLLYFLLALGDAFLRKLVHVMPTFSDKAKAEEIARSIEQDMSRYFGTVTLINLGLGVAVGIAMALLGMPNPLLWGVMTAIANYVPYLGALVGAVTIALVSFSTFPEGGSALVPPLVFLAMTMLESELVTPWILGRRLLLDPIVIFTGLLFWTFLWGIPGALLGVPLLFVIKTVSDHTERLKPLATIMGSERRASSTLRRRPPAAA